MYLSELKLWNFRKYGSPESFNIDKPNLVVPFNEGLNVLIGENDSGKTAIIDAIKLVLKTHAYEWIKVENADFYNNSEKLRIELEFKGLEDNEAKNFIEWLGWEGEGQNAKPILRLIYQVEKRQGKIQPADVKAGMDETGYPLNAEAREYLKTTYLKALRDADNDLTAKKNSRLSQILQEHKFFKKKNKEESDDKIPFVEDFKKLNTKIENWFKDDVKIEVTDSTNKSEIKDKVDGYLQSFISKEVESIFSLGKPEIKNILEKISLGIVDNNDLGLGTMNRLYMAAELLHLKKDDWNGLRLCLIEELEAHLHPQAQMKIIEALQKEKDVQFILTTHSPNLASKVKLHNLILCSDNDVFPLGEAFTKLGKKDYKYLERFLDVTKSNLFFANGIIIVEGWSEEILIPEIAKRLGYDFTEKEVSIINVASTAYLHFAKIFLRNDNKILNIPVSIVTDLDNRPEGDGSFDSIKATTKKASIESKIGDITNTNLKLCLAKEWTLEWCLFKSPIFSNVFKDSVFKVHSSTDEFKKIEDDSQQEVYNEADFTTKLTEKLKNKSLKKVRIANELVEIFEKETSITKENIESDKYLDYLVKAIKHACNEN